MLRRNRSKRYAVLPLEELSEEQLLQLILITLERMEDLLKRINLKAGPDADVSEEEAAEKIAAWVNKNTAALSEISIIDPDLKPLS